MRANVQHATSNVERPSGATRRDEAPKFHTVTGADFGRSIAWARRTRNEVRGQIEAAKLRLTQRRRDADEMLHEQMQGVLR